MENQQQQNPLKRQFSIEYLLNQAGSGKPRNVYQDFIREIETNKEKSEKFKLTRHKHTFMFENLQKISDPVSALHYMFDKSIEEAAYHAKENGYDPDRLGVRISAPSSIPISSASLSSPRTPWMPSSIVSWSSSSR